MVRSGLSVIMYISSTFLFLTTTVHVVSSYPIFANNSIVFDDTSYLYKEMQGKDCNWIAMNPEERCVKKDSKRDYDRACLYCQATCFDAGFHQSELGFCYPLRSVSDIRFNKLPPVVNDEWYVPCDDYVNGCHKRVYPMLPTHYPFENMTNYRSLIQQHTNADSVVMPGDFELKGKKPKNDNQPRQGQRQGQGRGNDQVRDPLYDPQYWLENDEFTNKPIYPGEDLFWDELRNVIQVQLKRRNGEDPASINRWPDQWADKDLEDIASAVSGEYPAFHQQTFIESMFRKGIELYDGIDPFRSHVDFVGKQVRIADINTWAFHAVAAVNFMLKWHVGMPRPEEMAWLIASRKLTTADDGVPQDIVSDIESMNLQNAHDFTAYNNGCPTHPSWPAMHSAGSTVSYWLPVIAQVTGEDYCEALRVDYAVSYGRTVAGVHYQQDNLAGLNIGQRLIRKQLPKFLESKYGYNAEIIKAKLDALSFGWETFDPVSCQIDGVSASVFLTNAIASVPQMSSEMGMETKSAKSTKKSKKEKQRNK